mmetsp:Transcript_9101/g.16375  ORF Transcript_9101/g.16375 Transcript_9101/m.16375 type:complete len:450 (-) Transcript_9101:30-1379(-)
MGHRRDMLKARRLMSLFVIIFAMVWLIVMFQFRISFGITFLNDSAKSTVSSLTTYIKTHSEAATIKQQVDSTVLLGSFPRLTLGNYFEEDKEVLDSVQTRLKKIPLNQTRVSIDFVAVVIQRKCIPAWIAIRDWMVQQELLNTEEYQSLFRNTTHRKRLAMHDPYKIDLFDAPISITHVTPNALVYPSQVSRMLGHLNAWRFAFYANASRLLVLEHQVVLTNELSETLPELLYKADKYAVVRKKHWHLMRLHKPNKNMEYSNECWERVNEEEEGKSERVCEIERVRRVYQEKVMDDYEREIEEEKDGSAVAYVLSEEGVNFMLSHIVTYHGPLETMIRTLREAYPHEFVELNVCVGKRFEEKECLQSTRTVEWFVEDGYPESASEDLKQKLMEECSIPLNMWHEGNAESGHRFPSVVGRALNDSETKELQNEYLRDYKRRCKWLENNPQ